jgi:hypothetical protein
MHMLWLAWIYEVGSRGIVCATFSCKVMPLSKLISGIYVFCLIIPSVCFHFANWFNIYFLGRTKMTRSREYISRFFFSFATVIYAQLQLFCFSRGHLCFHAKHMFGKDLSFLAYFDFRYIATFSYNRDERSCFRLKYSLLFLVALILRWMSAKEMHYKRCSPLLCRVMHMMCHTWFHVWS